jgi:hypothetical protein
MTGISVSLPLSHRAELMHSLVMQRIPPSERQSRVSVDAFVLLQIPCSLVISRSQRQHAGRAHSCAAQPAHAPGAARQQPLRG